MATRTASKSAASARPAPRALKELFSYRLNRLAYVSSRIAAGLNESRYGVGPREWRIIALLGAAPDMSLNAVAREAMERMLDKLTAHALEMLNECKAEVPARRGRGVQPR